MTNQKSISPLRQRMLDDMKMRKLSAKTQDHYLRAVKRLAKFLGESPDTAVTEDLRRFQLHLVEAGMTSPMLNATITGLRFFFEVTLSDPDRLSKMSTVREPRRLPVILSPEEVTRVLESAPNLKARAALSVAYATGLRAAAGLGRLETVESFFDDDGNLKSAATTEQMRDGFTWACEYGHTPVVEFLLDHGMDVAERLPRPHGQTGLHWAAHGGHLDTVNALLKRKAPVDIKDSSFDGTPLGWALVGWSVRKTDGQTPTESFYDVVAALIEAGAFVEPAWITPEKAQIDSRMYAILTGQQARA